MGDDRKSDGLVAALCGLGSFLLYAATACPTVAAGDSGELTVAARCLGVAHPTGFPLWCLLGRVAAAVPVGDVAFRLNLFSALTAAGAVALLCLLGRVLGLGRAGAATAALLWAVSRTFWSQAVVARVYPLAALVVVAQLVVAARRLRRESEQGLLPLLAFLFALGAGVHVICLVTTPLLLWGLVAAGSTAEGRRERRLALVLLLVAPLLYLYIPLRSLADPPLDWGNPETPAAFVRYMTQGDYGSKQLGRTSENLVALASEVGGSLTAEAGVPVALLALAGAAGALRRRDPAVALLSAPALLALGLVVAYGDDRDLPFAPYYLFTLYLGGAIAAAATLQWLGTTCARPRLAALAGAVAILAVGVVNHPRSGRAWCREVRAIAELTLASVPSGALLAVRGDSAIFPLRYLQLVEGRRPDVTVIPDGAFRPDLPWRPPVYLTWRPAALPQGWTLASRGLVYRAGPPEDGGVASDAAAWWRGVDTAPVLTAPRPHPDYKAGALVSDVLFKWGEAEASSGRPAEARRHFEEALAAAPRNRLVHYSVARALAAAPLFERERAEEVLARGVELDVALAGDPNGRGLRWLAEGFPERAVPCFEEALRAAPDSPSVAANLALARAGGRLP